jgi:hypothetical protein
VTETRVVASPGGSCLVGTVGAAQLGLEADRYYSNGLGPILTVELIFQFSNHLQNLKFKTKTFLVFKNIQTWHDG